MPTAVMTDEMLIDTGSEVITWGELQARKSVPCAVVKGPETHARELAHRIIMEFRPNGWQAKEDELYRLLLGRFESLTAPPARTYAEGVEDAARYVEGHGGVIPGATVFCSLVSGNNMPAMSGDDRDRLHPHHRKAFDKATANLSAAIRLLSQGEKA